MASYFSIGGSQYVEESSLDNNIPLDDLGTTVDLILDFNGGSVQSGQGYDIPTGNFEGQVERGRTAMVNIARRSSRFVAGFPASPQKLLV